MFDRICDTLHREMAELDEKYGNGSQLTNQDLEHIDKIAHALKSLATYDAMISSDSERGSYRGRSMRMSRYGSRDDRPYNYGVPEGYERSPRY